MEDVLPQRGKLIKLLMKYEERNFFEYKTHLNMLWRT